MTAGIYDFTGDQICEQGATLRRRFTLTDTETGDPVDLTDYTARMQIRRSKESSDVVLELTSENGAFSIDPLIGEVTLEVEADVTSALIAASYVYDLELVLPDSPDPDDVIRLLQGKFRVSREVTR